MPVAVALPPSSFLDIRSELLEDQTLDALIDRFTPGTWENLGAQSHDVQISLSLAVRTYEGGRRFLHSAVRKSMLEWLAKVARDVCRDELLRVDTQGTALENAVESGIFSLMRRTAELFADVENWDVARELTVEALRAEESVHGKFHRDTLKSMIALALLESQGGKHADALAMLAEAMACILQMGNEGSPEHLLVLRHKGLVLHLSGDAAGSVKAYREAVGACRDHLGQEHDTTLRSMRKLALALSELPGCEREAVEVALMAFRGLEKLHGRLDQRVLDCRAEIPKLQLAAGMAAEAVPFAEDNLKLNREKWKEHGMHPDSMRAALVLADVYSACGRIKDVPPLLEPTIGAAKQLSIDKTIAMMEARHKLGDILAQSLDTLDLSLDIFEDVARDRAEVLGPEHVETLDSVVRCTELLWRFGDRQRAALEHQSMLGRLQEILGPVHPLTLRTSRSLSNELSHLRTHHAEAVFVAVDEASTCISMLGDLHPETAESTMQAARVSLLVGYTKEAKKYATIAVAGLRKSLAEATDTDARIKLQKAVCDACGLLAAVRVATGDTTQAVENLIKEALRGIDVSDIEAHQSLQSVEVYSALRTLGVLYTTRGSRNQEFGVISRGLDLLNKVRRMELKALESRRVDTDRTRQAIADAKDALAIIGKLKK